MAARVPREWQNLEYRDPKALLVGLRKIAQNYSLNELEYEVASLRTHDLHYYGEGRQAALFCYGMGQALGLSIDFAQDESRDHDIITRFVADNVVNYVPVQLKEWVPESLNSAATLQEELDKLEKYQDASDLAVAVHLNRNANVNFAKLRAPTSTIRELWLFGARDATQERWWLVGNFMAENVGAYEFEYPRT